MGNELDRSVGGSEQLLALHKHFEFFSLQRFLVSSSSCPGCPRVQFKFSKVMWSYFHWRDWLWHPLRLIRHGSQGFAFKGHHKLSGLAIWAENPWMCAIILIFLINFEDTEVVSANHSIFKTFCLLAILGLHGMWSENSKEWALVRQRLNDYDEGDDIRG